MRTGSNLSEGLSWRDVGDPQALGDGRMANGFAHDIDAGDELGVTFEGSIHAVVGQAHCIA
jgi:hypothetical protein